MIANNGHVKRFLSVFIGARHAPPLGEDSFCRDWRNL